MLSSLALAGCVTDDLAIDHATNEIIGGSRSIGAQATVLLASYPADRSVLLTCTAVVVAPTVLLTAAHCVDRPNHLNHIYGVFPGDDASAFPTLAMLEPQLLPVAVAKAHPQYETTVPFFADIGVVVLRSPIANTPVAMQRDPIDDTIVGMPAQIIGYGQTVFDQPNLARFEATTTVASIDEDTIVVGDANKHGCLGDSGGPVIVDGKVAGVDSFGPVGCTAASHYRRVDFFLPFIDPFLTPDPDPDPDPDPMPDPDPDPLQPVGEAGGCAVGGGAELAGALALMLLRRRRR
ncbi:MAG: trypsin-like serine protease [Kofleriaceae bacterium]